MYLYANIRFCLIIKLKLRMKRFVLFLFIGGLVFSANAQELQVIKLNEPSKSGGSSVMEAFSHRKSGREISNKKLTTQDLSDLVWAAAGINRKDKDLRTAPSWRNYQDIDLYVCFPEGVYFYNAKEHVLEPFAKGNFYPLLVTIQPFVNDAPVILLLVTDLSKMKDDDAAYQMVIAGIDAGIVSQNISIFCAGKNMVTVPRGFMEKEELKKAIKLKDSQHIMLNHPVGYEK